MNLAEKIYLEACAFLEKAQSVDTAHLAQDELEVHEGLIVYYKNIKNEVESARKGQETSPTEVAKRFIEHGMSTELIMRATGMSFTEIENLRPKKNDRSKRN